MTEKLSPEFDIALYDLEDMIGDHVNGDMHGYKRIVSPRELQTVDNLVFMKEHLLDSLLRHIPLRSRDDGIIYPYEDADIRVYGIEPKGLYIGQKFALDTKLIDLMVGLEERLFAGFLVKGISKMPPAQLYGTDYSGRKAIAFYLPPIVEVHDNMSVLVDGTHRSKLCGSAGTTINGIHITGTSVPLPFTPLPWNACKIVSEKPPKHERYQDLAIDRFRDLTYVGIDG